MKNLKIDELFKYTKQQFDKFKDHRADNKQYSIGDCMQSGLAVFSLKDSSLLSYNNQITERIDNLKRIYKIDNCPGDGQMREVIDEVAPIQIERVKREVIKLAQQKELLKEFEYFKGYLLLAVDGVHHFSSKSVSCTNCLERNHSDGTITYSHSMLASVITHPTKKIVIPLCEELIVQQDGQTKNDCEINAAIRLFDKTRTRHMDLKFIRLEDALFANGPHIQKIQSKGDKFIICVKKGSGAGSVINQYEHLLKITDAERAANKKAIAKAHKLYKWHGIEKPIGDQPIVHKMEIKEKKVLKVYHYVNSLYLNEAHKEMKVNFVHYEERAISTDKILKRFDWITDITVTEANVEKIEKAGRARWKIENETFNTLKNQGYNFKHNFGHGEKNLCTNFALLMMLAFLIDQIQQLSNEVFQKVLEKKKWKKYIWEDVRSFVRTLPFESMDMVYKAILYGIKVEYLAIQENSE